MKKLVVVIIALLNVIGLYSQTYYKGWLITAKRKNSPDNPGSPTQMW